MNKMEENKEKRGVIIDVTNLDDKTKDINKRIVNKFGKENVHGFIMPCRDTEDVTDKVKYCEQELGIKCTVASIGGIKDCIIDTYKSIKGELKVKESDIKYEEGDLEGFLDCFMCELTELSEAELKLEENIRKALAEFTAQVTRRYNT